MKVVLDSRVIYTQKRQTILELCKEYNVFIPTLCHDDRLEAYGGCRLCIVEILGKKELFPACSTYLEEGMKIITNSQRVIHARKKILEFLIFNHPLDCMNCQKAGNCKFQDYCYEYEVTRKEHFIGEQRKNPTDDSHAYYIYDPSKCIMCGKCVRICGELQGVDALGFSQKGFASYISVAFDENLSNSNCISCGNCVSNCPVGALTAKYNHKFRNWQVNIKETFCPDCSILCPIKVKIKDDILVDVEPIYIKEEQNRGLLCKKGKFEQYYINHPDRIVDAFILEKENFRKITSQEAILKAAKELKYSSKIGVLLSLNLGFEQILNAKSLFSKIKNVQFWGVDIPKSSAVPKFHKLLNAKLICIFDLNLSKTHPSLDLKIRQLQRDGSKVILIAKNEEQKEIYNNQVVLIEENFEEKLNQVFIKKDLRNLNQNEKEIFTNLMQTHNEYNQSIFIYPNRFESLDFYKETLKDFKTQIPLAIPTNHRSIMGIQENPNWIKELKEEYFNQEWDFIYIVNDGIIEIPFMKQIKKSSKFIMTKTMFWDDISENSNLVLPMKAVLERDGSFIDFAGKIKHINPIFASKIKEIELWDILKKL